MCVFVPQLSELIVGTAEGTAAPDFYLPCLPAHLLSSCAEKAPFFFFFPDRPLSVLSIAPSSASPFSEQPFLLLIPTRPLSG